MSFLNQLKRLLQGETITLHQTAETHSRSRSYSSESTPSETGETEPPAFGTVLHHEQDRHVAFRNNEVSGYCNGRIEALTGPALLCLFEELPAWMTSLTVRVLIHPGPADLHAALSLPTGEPVELTGPEPLETECAVRHGKVLLRLTPTSTAVSSVSYEISII